MQIFHALHVRLEGKFFVEICLQMVFVPTTYTYLYFLTQVSLILSGLGLTNAGFYITFEMHLNIN